MPGDPRAVDMEALRSVVERRRVLLAGGALSAVAVMAGGGQRAPSTSSASGQEVNVRILGAKGDGVTDDSSAVQSALNKGAASSTPVVFPAGRYRITRTLQARAPLHVAGQGGAAESVLVFEQTSTPGMHVLQSTDHPAYPPPLIQIHGLGFNYSGTAAALLLDESKIAAVLQDTFVTTCRFDLTGGSGSGVESLNQRGIILSHNHFLGSGSGTGIALVDSSNSKLISNLFFKLEYGVHGEKGTAATIPGLPAGQHKIFDAGCVFIGNDLVFAKNGLRFDNWELVQAVGNIIDECDYAIHMVDCFHSIIDSNYLATTGAGAALLMETQSGPFGENVIRGNIIRSYRESSAGTANVEILGASAQATVDSVIIEGNVIGFYAQYGLHLRGATNVLVNSNIFSHSPGPVEGIPVYDETPGSATISGNVVDGPVVGKGDVISGNQLKQG